MKLRIFAAAIAVNLTGMSAALALDQSLPAYQAVTGISGQLKSVGSDTLNIEMTLWAKRFKDLYPWVNIEIEGKARLQHLLHYWRALHSSPRCRGQ